MRRVLSVTLVAMIGSAACGAPQRGPAKLPAAQSVNVAGTDRRASTAAFWAWFEKNAATLRAEKDLRRTMDTISAELGKVHPEVFAEIAGFGRLGDDRELVISVDGKREVFPVVQEIYAARPKVAGWTIVAFRPRRDPTDPFVIEMNGKKLDARSMKFTAARNGDKLDVAVFVPGFTTLEELGGVAFILLDHLVGEYDMETRIGGISFAAIDQAPTNARPLVDLPTVLDATLRGP
jgi:hypothetical protein